MTRTRVPEVIRRMRCEETRGVRRVRRPAHEEAVRMPGGATDSIRNLIRNPHVPGTISYTSSR